MAATVSAPTMPPPPVPPTASRLLTIAPEIRNRIYRYALLSSDPIELTTLPKQPALLFTCRQIRSEATKMWYFGNEFKCLIDDCDARLICRFTTHLTQKFTKNDIATYMFVYNDVDDDGPNWANLMVWCRSVLEGKGYGPRPDVDCSPTMSVVTAIWRSWVPRGRCARVL